MTRSQNKTKKLRYREEYSVSVVLGWCTYDISREKIFWWLINHFDVIGHEGYRIWQRDCARSVTERGGGMRFQTLLLLWPWPWPDTLIYEINQKIMKLYLRNKNELCRSSISKVRVLQTDRQTVGQMWPNVLSHGISL